MMKKIPVLPSVQVPNCQQQQHKNIFFADVMECWNAGMPGMLECQNARIRMPGECHRMLECQNAGMPECQNARI